jgi:hypothetical protein
LATDCLEKRLQFGRKGSVDFEFFLRLGMREGEASGVEEVAVELLLRREAWD